MWESSVFAAIFFWISRPRLIMASGVSLASLEGSLGGAFCQPSRFSIQNFCAATMHPFRRPVFSSMYPTADSYKDPTTSASATIAFRREAISSGCSSSHWFNSGTVRPRPAAISSNLQPERNARNTMPGERLGRRAPSGPRRAARILEISGRFLTGIMPILTQTTPLKDIFTAKISSFDPWQLGAASIPETASPGTGTMVSRALDPLGMSRKGDGV